LSWASSRRVAHRHIPWAGAAAVRQRYHDLFAEVSYFTLEDYAVFSEYLEQKLIRRQIVG